MVGKKAPNIVSVQKRLEPLQWNDPLLNHLSSLAFCQNIAEGTTLWGLFIGVWLVLCILSLYHTFVNKISFPCVCDQGSCSNVLWTVSLSFGPTLMCTYFTNMYSSVCVSVDFWLKVLTTGGDNWKVDQGQSTRYCLLTGVMCEDRRSGYGVVDDMVLKLMVTVDLSVICTSFALSPSFGFVFILHKASIVPCAFMPPANAGH